MSRKTGAKSKEQKLKSALRDNLKKRKQFARSLGEPGEQTDGPQVKLRIREISAKEISTKRSE